MIAALSLGTDLGLGQPMEHVLRQCVLALGLAERFGLDDAERAVVYYVALLAWVGCHSDSYERASGRDAIDTMRGTHCVVASELAGRLGLGEHVRKALLQVFERWDGKGAPAGLASAEIQRSVRLVQLADVVEVFDRAGGIEAATAVARERSGKQLDPEAVKRFCEDAPELLAPLAEATSWEAVIEAQPGLRRPLSDSELQRALEAIADFVDLKSPYVLGHSRAVADLAAQAARDHGLSEQDVGIVRRAALVEDWGRLGVSNAIWDKREELTAAERERIRLHAYLGERMLSASAGLAPLAALAAQHHERLDGSGYPRALRGGLLSPAARILAAADTYCALVEDRPHRAARSAAEASAELRAEVRRGRLDGDAVSSVLRAAGHVVTRRGERPAGLTPRELEVLRLLARGLSNKEIAERLRIAPKTVGNHVEHVYMKIGVSSRAAASLYATEHGLLSFGSHN